MFCWNSVESDLVMFCLSMLFCFTWVVKKYFCTNGYSLFWVDERQMLKTLVKRDVTTDPIGLYAVAWSCTNCSPVSFSTIQSVSCAPYILLFSCHRALGQTMMCIKQTFTNGPCCSYIRLYIMIICECCIQFLTQNEQCFSWIQT